MATGDQLTGVKTSDESITTDATLSLDSDMQVTVAANTTYLIKAWIRTATDVAIRFDFQFPGTPTRGYYVYQRNNIDFLDTLGTPRYPDDAEATDLDTVSFSSTTSLRQFNICHGLITTDGTGGTFGFRWAQIASNATASTVYAGSHIILTEV